MKKWITLISVLLITALSVLSASAKNSGAAVLTKAADSNNVEVAIELTEGATEVITSLRFQLYVDVESGEMEEPAFTFSDGLTSLVKDAKVTWDADSANYLVDVILSGKEDQKLPFSVLTDADSGVGHLAVGTLVIPTGKYYAEVGMAASDDEEDSEPLVQYMAAAAAEAVSVPITNAQAVYVGEKEQASPTPAETPSPTPAETPSPTPAETPSPTPVVTPSPAPSEAPAPTTTPEAALAAPKLEAASKAGTNKIDFSWNQISDANGYEIFVRNEKTGTYTLKYTVKGAKTTSYTAAADAGKTYTFVVRAYRASGTKTTYSSYSTPVTVSVFDKSKKLDASVKVNTNKQRIVLSWKKADGADGYQIYQYNEKKKKYVLLDTIEDAKTTKYRTEKKYANATEYTFKVRAYALDTDGKTKVTGKYSKVLKVTTPPAKVKGAAASAKNKAQAQITWKKVKNADGYRVFRSTSRNGKYTAIKTVKGEKVLSYTDTKAKSGKKYYYKVKAFVYGPEKEIVLGAFSNICSVTVK